MTTNQEMEIAYFPRTIDAGFHYDVFLSQSVKDKAVVRLLAEQLRQDKLNNKSQPSTLNCFSGRMGRRWRPASSSFAMSDGHKPRGGIETIAAPWVMR